MSQTPQGNLYHLILGLPEDVTSPNHYQLLGLDHRTGDSALIKSAAADQNRKLLHWQNSDRYAEVKALTFELVQARELLLKEDLRLAYDASLGEWGLEDQGPWIVEEPHPISPPPLSVRCPECEASFKLRNRDLIGLRIPCPECGFHFTVRPEEETASKGREPDAVQVAEFADSDAELAALENFDDMEDLPRSQIATLAKAERRRKADRGDFGERLPRARTSSRRSAPRGWRAAMIAGAALLGMGCCVLFGIWIYKSLSPSTQSLKHELAYLPADLRTLGYYRLGDVSRSPVFQDHLTRSAQSRVLVDQFRDRTGMQLHEIESVIIGLKDNGDARLNSLGANIPPQGLKFVAKARAAKDWDRARLIGTHSESATQNNLTYHTYQPDTSSAERWAFYLPDARTLIFGTADEVKAAIDTAGQVPDWPDVEFLQPDYPIVNANVAGSTSFRPLPSPGVFIPPGLVTKTQGAGLMLAGHEVKQVSFLRFESESDAAEFVRVSEDAEENRRRFPAPRPGRVPDGSGTTFNRHGLLVAVAYRGVASGGGPLLTHAVTPSLALLARLGKPAVNGFTSQQNGPAPDVGALNAIINPMPPRRIPPAEPLGPVPDAQTLTGLIAKLQNPNAARNAADQLAKMQPDPNRRKQVARLLEIVITSGRHFDKQSAADALGIWGSSENVPFLLAQLQSPMQQDVFLNRHILVALGRLKDPRSLPALVGSLGNAFLRNDAAKGLTLYGSDAEPELLKAMAAGDWQIQQTICNVLKDIGTRNSLPALDDLQARGHVFVKPQAQAAADAIRAGGP